MKETSGSADFFALLSFCRKTTLLKHLKTTHPSSPGFSHAGSWRAAQERLQASASPSSATDEEDEEDEDEEDMDDEEADATYGKTRKSAHARATKSPTKVVRHVDVVYATPPQDSTDPSSVGTRATITRHEEGGLVFLTPPASRVSRLTLSPGPDLSAYRFGTSSSPSSKEPLGFAPPATRKPTSSYPMTPSSSIDSTHTTSTPPTGYKFPPTPRRLESSAPMSHSLSSPFPIPRPSLGRLDTSLITPPHRARSTVQSSDQLGLEPAWEPRTPPDTLSSRQTGHPSSSSSVSMLSNNSSSQMTLVPNRSNETATRLGWRRRRASSTPAMELHDPAWHRERFEAGWGLTYARE